MSGEFPRVPDIDSDFTPSTWGEDIDWSEAEFVDDENMVELDLGPSHYRIDADIGPETAEEEAVFADAADRRYMETREPTGVHCMDDRMLRPGLQLPGGILETQLVSRLMNPQVPPWTNREAYERLIPQWRGHNVKVWVHGSVCAASLLKREALQTTASYPSAASNFTHQIMNSLDLDYLESDVNRAIYTGAERADKDRLWDFTARESLAYAGAKPCVEQEDFSESHRAAGLRIDVSDCLFNNYLFRKEHTIQGQETGLLSVTMGAYKKMLQDSGYSRPEVSREVIHASLFTFGLAKVIGHSSLRAAMVTPRIREA